MVGSYIKSHLRKTCHYTRCVCADYDCNLMLLLQGASQAHDDTTDWIWSRGECQR